MAWLAFGVLTREFADGETIVGSGADADWRVPTADLMPRHFVVTVHGLNTSIRPYSTDIVVVVNGAQLGRTYCLLNDGDVVAAGRGRFVYTDATPRVESPMPDVAEQVYLVDERGGVAHSLAGRSSTVGRDASNTVRVRDPRASRFHAEIRREAGGFALHSMGAAGTLRNGEPMTTPVMLREGDVVEIAFATFRFTRAPLPAGVTIAPPVAAMNDRIAALPTGGGQRVTLESTTDPTTPPASLAVLAAVVVLIGVLVVAGLIWLSRAR